jgi:hypothetical protein
MAPMGNFECWACEAQSTGEAQIREGQKMIAHGREMIANAAVLRAEQDKQP